MEGPLSQTEQKVPIDEKQTRVFGLFLNEKTELLEAIETRFDKPFGEITDLDFQTGVSKGRRFLTFFKNARDMRVWCQRYNKTKTLELTRNIRSGLPPAKSNEELTSIVLSIRTPLKGIHSQLILTSLHSLRRLIYTCDKLCIYQRDLFDYPSDKELDSLPDSFFTHPGKSLPVPDLYHIEKVSIMDYGKIGKVEKFDTRKFYSIFYGDI
jgi:hypothetical protein